MMPTTKTVLVAVSDQAVAYLRDHPWSTCAEIGEGIGTSTGRAQNVMHALLDTPGVVCKTIDDDPLWRWAVTLVPVDVPPMVVAGP